MCKTAHVSNWLSGNNFSGLDCFVPMARFTLSAFLFQFSFRLAAAAQYFDWKTFEANGVNLGGWLEQESTIDTSWWAKYSKGATDEWTLCAHQGAMCGTILEQRYASYITHPRYR